MMDCEKKLHNLPQKNLKLELNQQFLNNILPLNHEDIKKIIYIFVINQELKTLT